jgi:Fe-S oxidoreductase
VKALSEPDPRAALGDERLHEILDLCLMCKACKTECPLGVDMATLKTETLSHYHDQHGVPLRSRVFGAIRTLNRLGSAAAPFANVVRRTNAVRRTLERFVGITAQRPLPEFAGRNLFHRFRDRAPVDVPPTQGTLTFLADSFTTFTEPEIGSAAIELLERAGWTVRLTGHGCCGRASLSKGLVDDAKTKARSLHEQLSRTEPGSPIVGCEPSCLFTLRDEHLALLPGNDAVRDVAGRVRQVEELLVEAIDDGRLELRDDSWLTGRKLLFHGHCHQKAEVGTAATMALLRRIPGVTVTELDAGCCGMAGSFGFEAEHYETSMAVGNDRLFPAINAAEANTVIVATGVSCRQQIRHGTTRKSWHPVRLLAEALQRD